MKFKIIPNEQTPKVEKITTENDILLKRDRKLIEKFWSFARRQHNCAGLAANQCSCDGERIMKRFFAIKVNNIWDIYLEPEILEYIGEPEEKIEGCLTWIGKKIQVDRYPVIKIKYFTLNGDKIEREIDGFEAQVCQHECNHLMGVEEEFCV